MKVVVIQRTVPHYRAALFDRLHERFGWVVATDRTPPGFGIKGADPAVWRREFNFRTVEGRQYRAGVPVRQIIHQLEPDAILAEFSLQMSSTWELAARRSIERKPMLGFWSQGWNHERGFSNPFDLASQSLRLLLLRAADCHIAYTQDGADFLKRVLPSRKGVFVARNTLDIASMPGTGQDDSPEDPASANIIVLGRITPDKRIGAALEAFRIVHRHYPQTTLTIVGDGPEREELERRAQDLGKAVRFQGAIYDEERIAALLQRSTLLLIPGSAGLSVNHALAYGVPVMLMDSSDIRHHPEHAYVIDGLTGWRVKGSSSEQLGKAIIAALAAPVSPKKALSDGLRGFVAEELAIENMLAGFEQMHDFLSAKMRRA